MYTLLVGEIGFSRREFLRELRWWEVRCIIDGYRRRERTVWSVARWHAFMVMHNGMTDLAAAGIHSVTDLLRFPWEKEDTTPSISDDDIRHLQQLMREENEKNGF